MAKWFYYNESGEKIEVTGGQLKGLAKAGMITRDTIVETEEGKTAPARRVKGLTFIESAQPQTTPPAEADTFTAEEQAEIDKFLAKFGSDVKSVQSGLTSLHLVAMGWNGAGFAVARYFVSQGVDVHAKDNLGRTPLHEAAGWGKLEIAKLLISQGADIHAKDNQGNSPLWQAATSGFNENVEVLAFLISCGADVNAKNSKGETLLHTVGNIGGIKNIEFVKCLVSNGADVNVQNKNSNTPLHEAAKWCKDVDIVKYLVSQCADVRAQGQGALTPLNMAKGLGNTAVAEYLASINASTTSDIMSEMVYGVRDAQRSMTTTFTVLDIPWLDDSPPVFGVFD